MTRKQYETTKAGLERAIREADRDRGSSLESQRMTFEHIRWLSDKLVVLEERWRDAQRRARSVKK